MKFLIQCIIMGILWVLMMFFTLIGLTANLFGLLIMEFATAFRALGGFCLNKVHQIIAWGDEIFGVEL
jgi:hypothetical protein